MRTASPQIIEYISSHNCAISAITKAKRTNIVSEELFYIAPVVPPRLQLLKQDMTSVISASLVIGRSSLIQLGRLEQCRIEPGTS